MSAPAGPKATWATARALQRLRDMWAAGVSTRNIGDALGVTKNAVVGMRRTLELPGRPSPIAGGPRPKVARAAQPVRALPALASDRSNPGLVALDAPLAADPFPASAAVPDAPRRTIQEPTRHAAIPIRLFGRIEPCCWVTAMATGGRLPIYCDTDGVPGLPYCVEHAKLAYPALKQRRRERAAMGAGD